MYPQRYFYLRAKEKQHVRGYEESWHLRNDSWRCLLTQHVPPTRNSRTDVHTNTAQPFYSFANCATCFFVYSAYSICGHTSRRADNLTTFMCRLYRNSGSFNLLEPSGPVHVSTGTALPSRQLYLDSFCTKRSTFVAGWGCDASWIQPASWYPIHIAPTLILFSHLRLGLSSGHRFHERQTTTCRCPANRRTIQKPNQAVGESLQYCTVLCPSRCAGF
jgi:hypothetical protein